MGSSSHGDGIRYWKDRLTCQGCFFPLSPPVFYCGNGKVLHPLCGDCPRCNVPGCTSKISANRSVILEKLLAIACFACEFNCQKSLLEASEYKVHVGRCHLRPLNCSLCEGVVPFRQYECHLKSVHDMRESRLDQETLILDFAKGQPRVQYVQFEGQVFLIRYDNHKLWVEALGTREKCENYFKIRISGVKYNLEFELKVHNPREGLKSIQSRSRDPNNNNQNPGSNNLPLQDYAIPPPDEELFLLFIEDSPSTELSSMESVPDGKAFLRSSVYV